LERPFRVAPEKSPSQPTAQAMVPENGTPPIAEKTTVSKETVASQMAALPLIRGTVTPPEKPEMPVEGEGLDLALRLIRMNETMSLAKARPATMQGIVRPTVLTTPAEAFTSSGMDKKRPMRVWDVSELQDTPLRIQSVQVSNPDKIIVRFQPHAQRGVTAWFSENCLEQGLSNLYRVYVYRLLTVPMVVTAPSESSVSAQPSPPRGASQESSNLSPETSQTAAVKPLPDASQEDGTRESSPMETSNSSPPRSVLQRPLLEERYDARYTSTLYITSAMSGGPNG
jgi:hypothetical protein